MRTFKNLSLGEVFEFTGTARYGMAPGPWRKVSARVYEHAVKGGRYTVGSVNAPVDGAEDVDRSENPDADFWHVYGSDGSVIQRDLRHKTALGALKSVFPHVHVYSYATSGNGRTVSYAIDLEPRHVFVSKDADFDLRRGNPTPRLDHWEQASQRAHAGPRGGLTKKPTKRLIQRRLKTHHQPLPGVWANPLVRVKVKSPAQRGKAAPSERLLSRRKTTQKAPPGFYANPLLKSESNADAARYAELYGGAPATIRAWSDHFIVRFRKPGEHLWTPIAVFKMKTTAVTFAKEHARLHPTYSVSVIDAE